MPKILTDKRKIDLKIILLVLFASSMIPILHFIESGPYVFQNSLATAGAITAAVYATNSRKYKKIIHEVVLIGIVIFASFFGSALGAFFTLGFEVIGILSDITVNKDSQLVHVASMLVYVIFSYSLFLIMKCRDKYKTIVQ